MTMFALTSILVYDLLLIIANYGDTRFIQHMMKGEPKQVLTPSHYQFVPVGYLHQKAIER